MAGETMVLGVPAAPGRLRHAHSLELEIGGEGVDASRVRRIQHRPTGLYLREKIGRKTRAYYSEGSAAYHLAPQAFDLDYLEDARFSTSPVLLPPYPAVAA